MTCIVGVEHQGHVYLGGDAAGVSGDTVTLAAPKVFLRGPMVFGYTWTFRTGQVLQYVLDVPPHRSTQSDMAYLVNDFANALRTCFKDAGCMGKESSSGVEQGGQFLLGYRGKLYTVMTDCHVQPAVDGYAAVGSGQAVALGALYAAKDVDPKRRLLLALGAAAKYDRNVCPPFTVVRSRPWEREPDDGVATYKRVLKKRLREAR